MRGGTALETARLLLRSYSDADIPELLPLVGSREVAATTLRIAHPYTEQDAWAFLRLAQEPGKTWLAITLRNDGRQIGGIGLRVEEQHRHAELGYWLGVPYWGKGYATEAAREMVRHGFEDLNLHRIFASHFKHNPASGRILTKLGMRYEGCQREHLRKWDQYVDSELYGLLRQEWEVASRMPNAMAVQVTIYLNEADQWHRKPLHLEILNYLRKENVYAATAIHCVAGFLGRQRVETAHLIEAGGKLPVIIIFVDTDEHVNRVLPTLKEMAEHRLIVRENVVLEQGNLD